MMPRLRGFFFLKVETLACMLQQCPCSKHFFDIFAACETLSYIANTYNKHIVLLVSGDYNNDFN